MKKYFVPFAALSLVLAGCSSNDLLTEENDGQITTITVKLPGDQAFTRAGGESGYVNSALSGLKNEANQPVTISLYGTRTDGTVVVSANATATNGQATFELTNVKRYGEKIKFVSYAHIGDASTAPEPTALESITVSNELDNEQLDAFYASVTLPAKNNMDITLNRPLAKVRLVATDWDTDIQMQNVEVTYANGRSTTFNASTGQYCEPEDGPFTTSHEYVEFTSDSKALKGMYTDYIPTNATEDTQEPMTIKYSYKIEGDNDVITRTLKLTPEALGATSKQIPTIKRNSLTTLRGELFSVNPKVTVTIDDAIDDPNQIELAPGIKANTLTGEYEITADAEATTDLQTIFTNIEENQIANPVITIADGKDITWNHATQRGDMFTAGFDPTTLTIQSEGRSKFTVTGNGVDGLDPRTTVVNFKNIDLYDDTRYDYENGNNAWEY